MRNRERGAAHVNIFFFLVILVLFLGACLVGYAQLSENNDLKKEIAEAKQNAKLHQVAVQVRDEQLKALGTILGTGKFTPKADYSEIVKEAGLTELPTFADGPDPERVGTTLAEFGKALNVPESMKSLSDLLNASKAAYDTAVKRETDANSERTKALADRTELEKKLSEEQGARQRDVATANQQHNEFRATVDAGLKRSEELLNGVRAQLDKGNKDLEAEKAAHLADNVKNSKEINTHKAVISARTERDKLRNPPQAADGDIVESAPSINRAYINLGRRDMLPVGTVFRVTPRGKTDVKAYAEVIRVVDQTSAEVKITGVKDPLDPVVRGDQIANDLYSPNLKRTIVLIGRYSMPLTKPTVKMLLENLGNRVVDKIGPDVDLVIIGDNPLNEGGEGFTPIEETKEYKDALFYGTEIAPLNKIRDFLKLSE